MPNTPNSFADILRDWELLLEAANDNESVQTGAQPQREALAAAMAQVRALKARQDSCTASRQQATQDLREMVNQGRELARRLRGVAKAILGTKNERLVQFRVSPIRSRTRRLDRSPETTRAADSTVGAG
ncbi:MAG TPA: hypothetical protein VGS22_06995 [Thermoanaerobaculia bacterium]|jgi:hypothetical protein|nr:hypothetical protein [Thermoanaerobaculia bacterium]